VAIPVHAQAIHDAALTMGLLFPAGSGGAETRSKLEIWTDPAGFSARIDALAAATPTLVAAAKTRDAGAIGAALKDFRQELRRLPQAISRAEKVDRAGCQGSCRGVLALNFRNINLFFS